MGSKLKIATVQHPVDGDIRINKKYILMFIQRAGMLGADVVHFPECNLSGYAGIDFRDYSTQDQDHLTESLYTIGEACKKHGIFAVLGSHHFVKNQEKPFNSLYVINTSGEIIGRYDKRHLTQDPETDHIYFNPGNSAQTFEINGIKCGLLICHEWRYPEFYREYLKKGVKIIFQSFYDGRQTKEQYINQGKELGELIMGAMKGNAANNYMWISASNTCWPESSYPGFTLRPDGSFAGKLKRNVTGMIVTDIDIDKSYSDPSRKWRNNIIFGE